MSLCFCIWYFHSNATILCPKSNKIRHNRNEECTTANRSKYEHTQADGSLDTYQTSLHEHWKTIRPVFIWYFHSIAAILSLKSKKLTHHRNEECTTANKTRYELTQAGGVLTHTNHPFMAKGRQYDQYSYGTFTPLWQYYASKVTKQA